MRSIETDYLVIGAGAMSMAFVDTLLTDTDAQIVIVDRQHRPGGHWNVAYPFVRLHQPAAQYGVNSRELSQGGRDVAGWNAGLDTLSSGAEVTVYFDQLMQQRFLPSGRVRYLPMSQVVDGPAVESLVTGIRQPVTVRRKVVDGTHSRMEVPATKPPCYAVAPGVRCVPINALVQLAQPVAGYVIVGAGKTGMDACIWLLEQGVDPDDIQWIMPRDSWLLDRANLQCGGDAFMNTWESLARQLEAVAIADSVADLMARLERGGDLMRIDPQVLPTTYHGAIVSRAELDQLRRIRSIVRKGRVIGIEPTEIALERGRLPLRPGTLVVDCSAAGVPGVEAVPVWSDNRITLQWVRALSTVFSAAIIAHVEATFDDDAQKNALCVPIAPPTRATDWLRLLEVTMRNQQAWSRHPHLRQWLGASRLNSLLRAAMHIRPEDTERLAVMQRYQQAIRPALARLPALLATRDGAP